MIGEIGGLEEEKASAWLKQNGKGKKVVGFICGQTAPKEKRMGHAGAIVSGGKGDAQSKMKEMERQGVLVAQDFTQLGQLMAQLLGNK